MRSVARKLTGADEPPRTIALPKSGTVAALVRRPSSALGLAERRPPAGRRLRESPGVPPRSRIVLRAGGVLLR